MSKVQVGKVKSAHGMKGELYILIFSREMSWLEGLESLTLVRNGEERVFPIKKTNPHKGGFILSTDIQGRTEAESWKGAIVELEEQHLVSEPGETIFLREVMGFEVYDQGVLVGEISAFSSNGVQDLIVVNRGESQFEIPFIEPFILSIEFEKRQVLMSLPEGLLSV